MGVSRGSAVLVTTQRLTHWAGSGQGLQDSGLGLVKAILSQPGVADSRDSVWL